MLTRRRPRKGAYLERQNYSKFPATFVKPVALGKTALFHATFTTTMRLLGFGFHARSTFMREKCAKCSKGNKTRFLIFSHLFTPFSHFVRAFFTLVCRKETNKTRANCDGFPQRGTASLFLDLQLSDKTCDFCQSPFFSLRLRFLGRRLPAGPP